MTRDLLVRALAAVVYRIMATAIITATAIVTARLMGAL